MKFSNNRELQQFVLNLSSDITNKDLIKIHKKRTAEPYFFLVNNGTLASENPLRLREKIFLIYNKTMTSNDQIRDEKLQYDINRKAAEISALSSGKTDNYEYPMVKKYYHRSNNK